MSARDFLPPMTSSPDLFLLDARFAHFGFPSVRTSRIHSRAAHLRNRNLLHNHPHYLNPLHRATLPMDAFPPSYPEGEGRDVGVEWRSQPCLLQRKLDVLADQRNDSISRLDGVDRRDDLEVADDDADQLDGQRWPINHRHGQGDKSIFETTFYVWVNRFLLRNLRDS